MNNIPPEPFVSFANSYRSLFASMLAVSSSGIAAFFLIVTREPESHECFRYIYYVGLTSFIISAVVLTTSIYVGLCHEVHDGEGRQKDQRSINKTKFKIISIALVPFFIGIVCLLLSGYFIV